MNKYILLILLAFSWASSSTALNILSEEEIALIRKECDQSSRDLESINTQIIELQKGNLRQVQFDTKIKDIMDPWYKKGAENKCNGTRANNDILCPPYSLDMQLVSIADNMIAIDNSLKFQMNQNFTKESILEYFKKSRVAISKHCQDIFEGAKKDNKLEQPKKAENPQ